MAGPIGNVDIGDLVAFPAHQCRQKTMQGIEIRQRQEYVATERRTGRTRYTLRKMLRLSLQAVMGLSSKPLRFSFYFGLLTAIFCVLYAGFAVVALVAGKTVQGWTSVIVMVTFLGAVQLVSIGIVGEYLARVYDQSRGIPRYVIVEGDEAAEPGVPRTKY